MVQGHRIVAERDRKKRTFQEMSATEQQVLEDFETGIIAKQHARECQKKMFVFRGKML